MLFDESPEGGCGETVRQDEAVTKLSHNKILRRVRDMTRIAAMERERSGYVTLDDILRDITTAKEEHRAFLREIQHVRDIQTRNIARQARLLNHEPFPHPRPWNDSPLLDPERERMTPEAIAGDAFVEFQEIKRARRDEATKHPSWKYPNADRMFGEPPLYCCTNSYKKVLETHLVEAVAKLQRSYEGMEEGTLRLSNLKADVGAELWLMQSSLDEVRKGLRAARESERLRKLDRATHQTCSQHASIEEG